ncbi:TPA: UDP-glucose 6-dehydrogenase [candidate division WOR-3 bacterium]|uniref:UDP-glucose 6-dehydrogenase n=1 Tax=candidate division WOR-3 bacterium TaxID=2052148 RepID=A0A350HAS7_UNCW3|nr:UDP-glucose 6-dehydrogenase [candidate division WOR-3 bacterium]
MKISVIGTGYVGLVTGVVFAQLGHKVICMDKDRGKIENLKKGIMPIYEPGLKDMAVKNHDEGRLFYSIDIKEAVQKSDLIMIAVDTMPKENWQTDLGSVKSVAKDIAKYMNGYKIVVNKSTVPVGTGNLVDKIIKMNQKKKFKFDVVSNPEFLREGQAINDTLRPDRVIIGSDNPSATIKVVQLYQDMNTVIKITKLKSAELIKYASNSFLATKISFINSIADIAEMTGSDVDEIAEGIGLDRRIGREFLNAGIGYGGSCFPKDVGSLIYTAKELGYDFTILKEVKRLNEDRINRFFSRIKKSTNLKNKTVSILGLSFKPNTDDLREAPALKLIKLILGEKAKIRVYDPVAMENAKKILKNTVEYSENMNHCVNKSDIVILVTEWDEFKNADLKSIKSLMKGSYFFDGRNIYEPTIMKNLGFKYFSVGR